MVVFTFALFGNEIRLTTNLASLIRCYSGETTSIVMFDNYTKRYFMCDPVPLSPTPLEKFEKQSKLIEN